MFVIPREGFTVRDPVHMRALPPEGAEVPETMYWLQRLRDGDVSSPAAAAPAAKPKE